MTDVETRFWSKVRLLPTGCLLWVATTGHTGYGHFRFNGAIRRAHRVAWVLAGRVLPEYPYELHHLCENKWCVNVDHLVVVSHAENVARGNAGKVATLRARPDLNKCGQGLHDWTDENIYVAPGNGKKQCRPCNEARR